MKYVTSRQHVDDTDARRKRDEVDLKNMGGYFDKFDPLMKSKRLVCVTTGMAGGDTIDCYKAYEHGMKLVEKDFDKPFSELKFKKAHKNKPLSEIMLMLEIIKLILIQLSFFNDWQLLSMMKTKKTIGVTS